MLAPPVDGDFQLDTIAATDAPEPGALLLVASGIVAVFLLRRHGAKFASN